MKLGYYYHIPFFIRNSRIYLPDYFGIYIDALAHEVSFLLLVLHEARESEKSEINYALKSDNIELLSLGLKTPAWQRSINHKRYIRSIKARIDSVDLLIVRAPSPLAPYFHKYINKNKLVFMIVGDYADGAQHRSINGFRDRIVNIYVRHNHRLFIKSLTDSNIIVNSQALLEKYTNSGRTIKLIKTSTITSSDFYERTDTCQHDKLNILYTGRIDAAKGLFELLEAIRLAKNDKTDLVLNIAGWENVASRPVQGSLVKKANELDIVDNLVFHGKKSIGKELNSIYRMADIYTIPSYHEGFPRTIWEAMANSLPVIATDVGGIPFFLKNEIDCLLIEPKSASAIYLAIRRLIEDSALRKQIISRGLIKARENTVEFQSKRTIEHLNQLLD